MVYKKKYNNDLDRNEALRKLMINNTRGFKKDMTPWNKGTKGLMNPWHKGRTNVYSKEVLERMSLAKLGKVSNAKGCKHSEEAKEKSRISHLGKKTWNTGLTKEIDNRIKTPWLGKKRDIETIKKMSEGLRGNIPWNKGKKLPQFSGENNVWFGKHHSDETKLKLRLNHLGKPSGKKGKKMSEESKAKYKEWRKTFITPKKDSTIEVKIQKFLETLQIDYFKHKYININHGYQCDIFIPSMNLVIECDGDYWHKYPTGRDIDKIRTSELLEKGFKVLRLWERDIRTMDINKFKEKLQCQ